VANDRLRGAAASGGLLDSLARFGQSLLGAAQTRLHLVADELEEQGALVARMALLWALAGLCLLLAVMLLAVLLVVLFWESRVLVLSLLLALLVAIGAAALARARSIARSRPRAFSDLLEELSQDSASLARRHPVQ
jgi:uncharacterized membrane protein YqjE